MISILSAEIYRLKKSKLFWILLGLCVVLPILRLLLMIALAGIIEAAFGSDPDMSQVMELFRSLNMTNAALTDFASLLNNITLFAIICTSVVLSKEFTDGTMRNVILANKSRKQMFFAYLLTAMIIGVAYLLANFATIMIVYAPFYGFGDSTAGQAVSSCFCSLALGLLTVAFAESCVVMFLFCVQKQWATILFPLLICIFAPSLMNTIVNIITVILALQQEYINELAMSWIPLANASLYNAGDIDGRLIGKIALYYSIFTAVFIVSGYFTFEKKDLK